MSGRSPYAANIPRYYLFKFLVNFQLWLPIWVVYLAEFRDLSLTEITVLDTVFWLLLVLLEVPTGAIADRFGRRWSLGLGAGVNTIAVLVFAVAGTYPILLLSYAAWAAAWTMFSGADVALFYDSLKADGREGDYQRLIGRSWAVQEGGSLAALLIGAPIAAWADLQLPILLSGGLMAAATLVAFSFREPPRQDAGEPQLGFFASTRRAAEIVWTTRSIRYFIPLAATIFACASCVSILKQPFLREHGVAVGMLGLYSVPGTLLTMFAGLVAHRVLRSIGVSRVFMLVPLGVIGVATGLGAWDSLGAFVFYPLLGLVFGFSQPAISGYLNDRIPSAQRATILSMYQLLFSLLLAPLEPFTGVIADRSLTAAFQVLAITTALLAAPLLLLWLRVLATDRRQGVEAGASAG